MHDESRANRLAVHLPRRERHDQMNSGLQTQANMRPHSTPTQSWRGNTAPSGIGLHPKPVESWNRIPASDVATCEGSCGVPARLHRWRGVVLSVCPEWLGARVL